MTYAIQVIHSGTCIGRWLLISSEHTTGLSLLRKDEAWSWNLQQDIHSCNEAFPSGHLFCTPELSFYLFSGLFHQYARPPSQADTQLHVPLPATLFFWRHPSFSLYPHSIHCAHFKCLRLQHSQILPVFFLRVYLIVTESKWQVFLPCLRTWGVKWQDWNSGLWGSFGQPWNGILRGLFWLPKTGYSSQLGG